MERSKLDSGLLAWQSLANDPLLRLSAVARQLGVSHDTVRRGVKSKRLPSVKLCHGFYKVRRSAVVALLGSEAISATQKD